MSFPAGWCFTLGHSQGQKHGGSPRTGGHAKPWPPPAAKTPGDVSLFFSLFFSLFYKDQDQGAVGQAELAAH